MTGKSCELGANGRRGRRASALLGLVLGLVALAGCETPPPESRFPEMTFAHLGPIRLDVAEIEVIETYRSPLAPPNVEHLAPTRPAEAVRRWAADRLRAEGRGGGAQPDLRPPGTIQNGPEKTGGLVCALANPERSP